MKDRDGREIDFLLLKDGHFYPMEVKLNATPKREWRRSFRVLEKLDRPIGGSGVVCLCPEPLPLGSDATAVPVGVL